MFQFFPDECVSDHNERIRSIQIDKNFITKTFSYRLTDDEVVHSKRLGNKVLAKLGERPTILDSHSDKVLKDFFD